MTRDSFSQHEAWKAFEEILLKDLQKMMPVAKWGRRDEEINAYKKLSEGTVSAWRARRLLL